MSKIKQLVEKTEELTSLISQQKALYTTLCKAYRAVEIVPQLAKTKRFLMPIAGDLHITRLPDRAVFSISKTECDYILNGRRIY